MENESIPNKYARIVAIKWACLTGSNDCRSTLHWKLTNALHGGFTPPNLKKAIYCDGLHAGDRKEFMFLWNKMLETQDQAERELIIQCLGCSVNPGILRELLDSLIGGNDKNYREEERLSILESVYLENAVGLQQTMEFLKIYHGDTLEL